MLFDRPMQWFMPILLLLTGPLAHAQIVRQPTKPVFVEDVTDSMQRVREGKPAESMTAFLDRPALTTRSPIGGQDLTWRLELHVTPERVEGDWPLVLEIDESRLVTAARFDGQPLAKPDRIAFSHQWGGEGAIVLPLSPDRRRGTVEIDMQLQTHLYDNGIGRVRLRPAYVDEVIKLHKPDDSQWHWNERATLTAPGGKPVEDGQLLVSNAADRAIRGMVRVVHEDFFGKVLAQHDTPVDVPPAGNVSVRIDRPASEQLYKTRAWFVAGKRKGFEYLHLYDRELENRWRDGVTRLTGTMQFAWAHDGLDAPLPRDGWQDVKLPHRTGWLNQKAHAAWYRRPIEIPQAFAGQRVQLFISNVEYQVRVQIDGKRVGDFGVWDLPAWVDITEHVQPGKTHELELGVTGYSAMLRKDVTPRAPGERGLPARAFASAAPVSLSFGLNTVPELLAVPSVRTEFVPIVTRITPTPSLSSDLELVNDAQQPRTVQVRATVLDRGEAIASTSGQVITLAPSARQTTPIAIEVPRAKLWDVDHPNLYELRIELLEGESILDTRRERFGFRTFGISGDHFTLNGKRVNLLGGSHLVLTGEIWPVRPHPYRLLRHYHQIPTGFCAGRIQQNLADELGYLIKNEHPHSGAHHQDTIAWHVDETWSRLESSMRNNYRVLANHPSGVIWDVGNELIFYGQGESDRMGRLMQSLLEMDPTRQVTVGGSKPDVALAPMYDFHGWGEADRRDDFYFNHPDQRPSYYRDAGFFSRPGTTDRDRFKIIDTASPNFGYPARGSGDELTQLLAFDGRPVLFSEGHYYENRRVTEIAGPDTFLPLPNVSKQDRWNWDNAPHWMNWLVMRWYSVPNTRIARHAGSMIHVDRGAGRVLQPLAAFSVDRRTRFESGESLVDTWQVFNDVSLPLEVDTTFTLFEGERVIASKSFSHAIPAGEYAPIDLRLDLPRVDVDKSFRLHVEVTAADFDGYYRNDVPITVFAPRRLTAGADGIAVFDPQRRVLPMLETDGVALTPLASLAEYDGKQPLLIAPEALRESTSEDRTAVTQAVRAGARVIVLDHRTLPGIGQIPVRTRRGAGTLATTLDAASPVLAGLYRRDFHHWNNRENDQLVYWRAIEVPLLGGVRVYVEGNLASPLIEMQDGEGSWLFCQLNLQDALGHDPVARRVLANLIEHGTRAPGERRQTLLVSNADGFKSLIHDRLGLQADVQPTIPADSIARLIVMDGHDAQWDRIDSDALRTRIESGAILFVQNVSDTAATRLGELLRAPVTVRPHASDLARIVTPGPIAAGMHSGDFAWQAIAMRDLDEPMTPAPDMVGHAVVESTALTPILKPAFLSEARIGKGRVIVSTIRATEYSAPVASRALSMLLFNAGATLDPYKPQDDADQDRYAYHPVDLSKFANWPLADEPSRRGWHGGGPDNDMRGFPRGAQTLAGGVRYDLLDPEKLGGNGVLALSGTKDRDVLPAQIKDIPVNLKADRLYFLHNSAWGNPGFTYRIYYKEDLEKWIPGQPDPYVDVAVRPDVDIDDWYFAGMIERGTRQLTGASVAWSGETKASRSQNQRVGVYQFVWDNPHPAKTIAKIDILSPGKVGSGQLFVFAITAATRLDPAKIGPASLLPQGVDADRIAHHITTRNYGLVVLDNGTPLVLHDAAGNVLIRTEGWYLQEVIAEPGKKPVFNHLGHQLGGSKAAITRTTGKDGSVILTIDKVNGPVTRWSQVIRCGPRSITIQQQHELTVDVIGNRDLFISLAFNKDMVIANDAMLQPNARPLSVPMKIGSLTIQFDDKFTPGWYEKYFVNPDQVRWNFFAKQQAINGMTDGLTIDITVP